jgi:signal transduction histidine kinase
MNLRAKLLLSFAAASAVLLVPSLFAAHRMERLRHFAVEGRSGHAAAVAGLGRTQALVAELNRVERAYIATSDTTLGLAASAAASSLLSVYADFHASAYGSIDASLGAVVADLAGLAARVEEHVVGMRLDLASEDLRAMVPRFAAADRELALLAERIDALAREDIERADAAAAAARMQTLSATAVALAIAILLASFISHALTSPLRLLTRAMAHVADGGFEARTDLPCHRRDEIGELSVSFATMARRLAELDRTKSEFFGTVSHELKTPLNAIRAYAEVLEDDLGEDSSDFHRALMSDVSSQAQAMARLVGRLMDLSRLAAGTYRLDPEEARIEDLAGALEKAWERRAADAGVHLAVRVAPGAPERATLDVDIVREEVLGNLISNALRVTPAKGRVDVTIGGTDGGVSFSVTDTGAGIPDEHRDLIFKKHYVVDRRSAVGSGLGLAIAKEMVDLHGGLISLEASRPGRGARFRVVLPLVPRTSDLEVPPPGTFSEVAPRDRLDGAPPLVGRGPLAQARRLARWRRAASAA